MLPGFRDLTASLLFCDIPLSLCFPINCEFSQSSLHRREEVREVCSYCLHFHHLTDGEARVTRQSCFCHTGAFHTSSTWTIVGRGTPWGVVARKQSGVSSSHYSTNFEHRHKVVAMTLLLCLSLGTFHMLLEVWALSPFRRVPPLTSCADQTERLLPQTP